MEKIYSNPAELEKLAKEKYAVPPFLMMENAARAMADFILSETAAFQKPEFCSKVHAGYDNSHAEIAAEKATVVIACGKGNNGGDGYALARLLQEKLNVVVLSLEKPAAEECKTQYEMCRRLGLCFLESWNKTDLCTFEKICKAKSTVFVVDCIYGTGFHGKLDEKAKTVLDIMNRSKAKKLACDIPSAFYFIADFTLTMGELKLMLYSDEAKASCGKIILKEIGLAREKFEDCSLEPAAFLITSEDLKLPFRKKRNAHKGTYGHTAVFSGDKGGASILAATATLNFGSGLVTIIKHTSSELSQFKIPPALMLSEKLPEKTSCILLGPGVLAHNLSEDQMICDYFNNGKKKHSAVYDAGVFDMFGFIQKIKTFSQNPSNQIVLTPHLSELNRFLKIVKDHYPEANYTEEEITIENLANSPETKIKIGREINLLFPNAVLVMKSANTFICSGGSCYIIADGVQSLAKGGSGDILAGLIAALLAQGYSAKEAAITAAEHHALVARNLGGAAGEEAYNLTPEKLLAAL